MASEEQSPKRRKLSPPAEDLPATPNSTSKDVDTRGSWYSRSWARKSLPVTQVAKESISSAGSTAIEAASIIKDKITPPPRRTSSLALTRRSTLAKALPVDATTTKDHAMPESRKASRTMSGDSVRSQSQSKRRKSQDVAMTDAPGADSGQADAGKPGKATEPAVLVPTPRSWIGWLAGGDGTHASRPVAPSQGKTEIHAPNAAEQPAEMAAQSSDALPGSSTSGQDKPQTASNSEISSGKEPDKPGQLQQVMQRKSWLPLWSNSAASQSAPMVATVPADVTMEDAVPTATQSMDTNSDMRASDLMESTNTKDAVLPTSSGSTDPPSKPGAWIFFSRQKPSETSSLKDVPREGELAVANTESESKPRRASINLGTAKIEPSGKSKDTTAQVTASKTAKHTSKSSVDNKSLAERPAAETRKVSTNGASATAISPTEAQARQASPAPSKKAYEHLLGPTLRETLRMAESPTLLQQIARLFYTPATPAPKHLSLVKEPQRIKQALAIGVHGYFPAPVLQTVLGRPTGTSIKFAEMAARSIRKYTKKHNYDCSVKTAALEGEGRIAERIDLLWKLLLNWIDDLRKADFIMVACHSQGVPVATMLVAKLIHFGCISPSARIGICAMAGINLGPFTSLRSRFISGSAGELFEFSDQDSKVSKDYLAALESVLHHGVRLTYVGSIDDQLVSLESSLFAPVSHPHIFRAVSVDSRLHAPDFLLHLVILALKLRNLGVQDHGLLKELSTPLAGSLYGGEGHSRLYEDEAIYDLAIEFALETTGIVGVAMQRRDAKSSGGNPFILPFAMRGILEEDFVKSELQSEATQLLKEYDQWEPTTKQLKDVRYRLEGIRSKL